MCILTYIPAGVDIPWDGLFNGACTNPDGHGWAVARGDELVIGKSMDMHTAAAEYEEAMKALPGAVSLFHSRIATAGSVDEFNVHPFYVGGREDTVMAHNGILPARWQPFPGDQRSDTQLFADTMGAVAENSRGIPSRRIGRGLGAIIGSYNKLVFISVKSGHPMTRIINAHQGVWTEGVWHSNYGFERYKPKYTAYVPHRAYKYTPGGWSATPYDWEAEEKVTCLRCKGDQVDLGYCVDCTTCQDCLMEEISCLCYLPETYKRTWADKQGEIDEVDAWLEKKEKEREAANLEWEEFIQRQQQETQTSSPTVEEIKPRLMIEG